MFYCENENISFSLLGVCKSLNYPVIDLLPTQHPTLLFVLFCPIVGCFIVKMKMYLGNIARSMQQYN